MQALFEMTSIRGMELKNRLVRSATHEGMSDDNGCPTPQLFKLYERLAKGGIGLLITGYAYVSRDGISPFFGMQAIDRDELIPKYHDLVDLVHQNGAKIAMQIAHSGRQTMDFIIGTQPIAPSAVLDTGTGVMPREMTEEDIERVIEDFAQAARRVKDAGFDAVQIHCAHGYLLSTFICPHTNRRTDQWGGSTENRLRIVSEIFQRCRQQVGDDYPIMIKYSSWDKMDNGLSPEEGIRVGQMMAEMGYDCIEVSAGIFEDGGSTVYGNAQLGTIPPQAYNRHVARELKSKVQVPVILVGGITDPVVMDEIIQSGDADFVSMCRALISDPTLPNKIKKGKTDPSRCIHCNLCTGYLFTQPLRCYYGKTLKDEAPMLQHQLAIKPEELIRVPSGERKLFRKIVKNNLSPQFDRGSLKSLRALLEAMGDQTKLPDKVDVEPVTAGGVPAEWVIHSEAERDKVVLYLHGGGGVIGSCHSSRGLAANLAAVSKVRILSLDYRLAPENPPPAAVEDAVAAYRWLLSQNIKPQHAVFAGDSAGANIAVAAMVSLRDSGLPLPAATIMISPFLDYTLTDESIASRAKTAPFVTLRCLKNMATWYCGEQNPQKETISSLYADLSGLPPLLLHVGGDEILLSDSIRMADKAREKGIDVTLKVWPEMWHIFQLFAPDLPEGQLSLDEIGAYIRQHVF